MKIGSLFSGYGGLDMAVQSHFGGELAWYSEIEPAACKVLATLHPDVPNIGDITKVDWSQVEPVDIITGGYPCQPFSNAGLRKGKNDERHLWPYVRDAIGAIRPRLAVLENVRGHLTLGFGDVLADLASMGWDARWGIVRAAEAGAPHNRARLFILANPEHDGLDGAKVGRSTSASQDQGWVQQPQGCDSPIATDSSGDGHGQQLHTRGMGSLESEAEGGAQQRQRTWSESDSGSVVNNWGQYQPAIERWEAVIDRTAPAPTVIHKDKPRLNPAFVEWMMGLPAGHVTGHGLNAAQELKMLGNGVVPQQAALALQLLAVGA